MVDGNENYEKMKKMMLHRKLKQNFYNLATSMLNIYQMEMKSVAHRYICIHMTVQHYV